MSVLYSFVKSVIVISNCLMFRFYFFKDYIQCPYCQRRFNENAADRHISFCKEQAARITNKGKVCSDVKGKLPTRTQVNFNIFLPLNYASVIKANQLVIFRSIVKYFSELINTIEK